MQLALPNYVGCYADSSTRVLNGFVDLTSYSGWNALYYCQSQAIINSATYFGLQFGVYCFYGVGTVNLTTYGAIRPDSECNMGCSGNDPSAASTTLNCGGIFRNSIYDIGVLFTFLINSFL